MHCYERSSFSCLPCSSSGCITKHLMFELWRNSQFCFPSSLNVSLDFVSGILRPLTKENQPFPSGADFKRITVVNMKVILSVMYTTQAAVNIFKKFSNLFQPLFSLLLKQCTLLRGSLSYSGLFPQFKYMTFIYSY